MAAIDILLASYNGEKYIVSQLTSLISQSFKNWRLLIHDDGSTDNTISIIKKWCAIDSRIKLIEDGVTCGGAAANFMHLVRHAQADFTMFCDQDDIWFDNKIEMMLRVIREKNNRKPQVVYADSYVWFPSEGIKGSSTLATSKNLRQFLFNNGGHQGCSAIFNHEACAILSRYQGPCAMHDHLLQFIGLAVGEVDYILDPPLMLYRQHDNKVTGFAKTSSLAIKVVDKNRVVVSREHYAAIKQLYAMLCQQISIKDKRMLEIYLRLPRLTKIQQFIIVLKTGATLMNSRARILLKILICPYIKNETHENINNFYANV